MLKTYLYIPEVLEAKIRKTAQTHKQSKAEIMRQALEKGIAALQQQRTTSAQALLKLADIGKKYRVTGPKDSSENMDAYLWDKTTE